jgi:amidophosphoribosyltransferase
MQGDIEKIREFLGVDSLAYLSKEGLFKAVGEVYNVKESYCSACFTGKHPYSLPSSSKKEANTV